MPNERRRPIRGDLVDEGFCADLSRGGSATRAGILSVRERVFIRQKIVIRLINTIRHGDYADGSVMTNSIAVIYAR